MDNTARMYSNEQKKYTYADYLTWPEDERWQIINGEAYAMSPAPTPQHQAILRDILFFFTDYLKDKKCNVFPAPFDVRLPEKGETEKTTTTVVQPDITVVCDTDKIDDKGCNGSPDLIIEILSPSTAMLDMNKKYALYERHGIKEYWLVHPAYKVIEVFTLENGVYKKAGNYSVEDTLKVGIFEDFEINLANIFPAES